MNKFSKLLNKINSTKNYTKDMILKFFLGPSLSLVQAARSLEMESGGGAASSTRDSPKSPPSIYSLPPMVRTRCPLLKYR